jgi:single-strand DNA-binding protein
MAGEPVVTFVGRVALEPTIHFTQTGRAVGNFKVAVTPQTKENETWVDKETLWFGVSLWRGAEAAVDSIDKGSLVTVTGKLTEEKYTNKNGEEKTALNVDADSIGLIPVKAKQKQAEETPW